MNPDSIPVRDIPDSSPGAHDTADLAPFHRRAYKYWAEPASATSNQLLERQLRLAGDYRHALVEIENRSRALQRALWAWPMRDIPIENRKTWRADAGGDVILKAWSRSDEYKEWRDKFRTAGYAAVKEAYGIAGAAGLAWGTRLVVADAVEHARRTTDWVDDLRHTSCQRVAVQIQMTSSLSTEGLLAEGDTRLRLDKTPYALGPRIEGFRPRADGEVKNRGDNVRPRRLRELAIRVGSIGRDPIWARLHVLMHRPLPPGADIKWAWAQRRMIAGRAKWEVVFSLVMAPPQIPAHPSTSTVAVDIGWRRRDAGIRIAYFVGTDGHEGELVIPVEVERRHGKSADLRSIRDNHRNHLAGYLAAWRDGRAASPVVERLASVASWIRTGHFVRLQHLWSENREDGDEHAYEKLREFLKKDRHLWAWEANNMVRMKLQIVGRITEWAHTLCKRYSTVVIEDFDLTALKEVETPDRIASRSIQKIGPAEIRVALKAASGTYRAELQLVPAANTTVICAACEKPREIADRKALVLTCLACGFAEDQDRTAARNLLRANATDRAMDGTPLAPRITKTSIKAKGGRRTRKTKSADRSPSAE